MASSNLNNFLAKKGNFRFKETEAAKVPIPPTRMEHEQESKQRTFGKSSSSNAIPQARKSDLVRAKQEYSRKRPSRAVSQDRFDATDLSSDFDQTTVMSDHDQYDSHPALESGISQDNEFWEEEQSDGDADVGMADDDPTLDSQKTNNAITNFATIRPEESHDFQVFKGVFNSREPDLFKSTFNQPVRTVQSAYPSDGIPIGQPRPLPDSPKKQSKSTQVPQLLDSLNQTPKISIPQNPNNSLNSTHATLDTDSSPHTPTPSNHGQSSSLVDPKDTPLALDYDPSTFPTMPFSTLRSQPFHVDPRAPPSTLPSHLENAPLADKLKELCPLPTPTPGGQSSKTVDIARISELFASLPIEQYEECGDYLLEGFGALIERMKEARREKRKVEVEFEKLVEEREALVQKRKEVVEGGLKRLRTAGEGLVRRG